jgi:hypothetical protein
MASIIEGNVARTRHTDSTHNTNTTRNERTQDSGGRGETYRLFQAERDRDSFTRVPETPGRMHDRPLSGGSPGAGKLEGYDHNKLNDPSHNTPKYVVGRILQNYPNTPEGLRAALPEIQRHFPEARIVSGGKGDVLDFGSHTDPEGRPLGRIDVIRAAGGPNNGEGWQWLPINESGAAANKGNTSAAGGAPKNGGLPGGISLADLFAFLQSPEGQRILDMFLAQAGAGTANHQLAGSRT